MRRPDPDDVMLWPCGTWCYRHELHEMTHKSDDYEILYVGTSEWAELTGAWN